MAARIPTPLIYLRDKFAINQGKNGDFLEAQEKLIRSTLGQCTLVAACGVQPLIRGVDSPEPSPPMMHIWQLAQWDTLYNTMYALSEVPWYTAEVRTLKRERQELLVEVPVGYGIEPRAKWLDDRTPGYVYLYEEVTLAPEVTALTYLRELNWFTDQVRADKWRRVWSAEQITGAPSLICHLWAADSIGTMVSTLKRVANDPRLGPRYDGMMQLVTGLSRHYLYPESTERLDEQVRA
jgi:hypothetical protein